MSNSRPRASAHHRDAMIAAEGVGKRFVLHNQGGAVLDVLAGASISVARGEALALVGPSGSGKSTLLRILYGNYRVTAGTVAVRHDGDFVDITRCPPRMLIDVRRRSLGWVSQFLRVIPRVATLDIVMEPMLARGMDRKEAGRRAAELLERVVLPRRLWGLAPATFSGGEQQRVSIARAFAARRPILLLDEPTSALDAANRDIVVELAVEARESGAAIVGIFHDEAVRDRVATHTFQMPPAAAMPRLTSGASMR